MDVVFIRLLFVIIVGAVCFLICPFNLPANLAAAVGLLIGVAIVGFEWRLRAMSLKRLIGAAIGSVLGIFGAYLSPSSFATAFLRALLEASCRSWS